MAHSNPPQADKSSATQQADKSRPDQLTHFMISKAVAILYVLKGVTGKRYVEITNNLTRRLKEHRAHHSKAGEIIGNFTVIHTESFTDHKAARLREKLLKSGN